MSKQLFDDQRFKKDTDIDKADLETEMARIPNLLGYYGQQETLWMTVVDSLKSLIENRSAEIDQEIREAADRDGTKVTENQIKAKTLLDPKIQDYKSKLHKALEQKRQFGIAFSVIEQKSKQVTNLSFKHNAELDNADSRIPVERETRSLSERRKEALDKILAPKGD